MNCKKVSMLLILGLGVFSLSACGTAKKKTEVKQNPNLVVAVDEVLDTAYMQEVIDQYQSSCPDTEITVQFLPHLTNVDDEAEKKELEQLRVEIMAGGGPDLFLVSTSCPLFEDPVKNAYGGVFYDMESLLGQDLKGLNLSADIMNAGVIEGKRYLIPLGYSINGVLTDTTYLGDWMPEEEKPAAFLQEILDHGNQDTYNSALYLTDSLDSITFQSFMDYEEESAEISDDLYCLLQFTTEKLESIDNESLPVSLAQLGYLESPSVFLPMLYLEEAGQTPVFLPIPNGEDGVTASVNTYAAVRANSAHAEEAADLIKAFLSPEAQGANSWGEYGDRAETGYHKLSLPVNLDAQDGALRFLTETSIKSIPESEAKDWSAYTEDVVANLKEALARVNTARFSSYGNKLLFDVVKWSFESEIEFDLDQSLEEMTHETEFYFSE